MSAKVQLTPAQARGLADWMVKHGAVDGDALAPALTVLILRDLADCAEHHAFSAAVEPLMVPVVAAVMEGATGVSSDDWITALGDPEPIPRESVLNGLTADLQRRYGSPVPMSKHTSMADVARDALVFVLSPGRPCAHARAFFYQNERGETGCSACDMWDDAFAK